MSDYGIGFSGLLLAVIILLIVSAIRIFREYERGVVFMLGPLLGVKGAGPRAHHSRRAAGSANGFAHRRIRCAAAGRDHARQRVRQGNAVVYFRVVDPERPVFRLRGSSKRPASYHKRRFARSSASTNSMTCSRNASV